MNLRLLPRPLSIISGSSSSIVDIITFLLDYCLWCFCVQVFQSTVAVFSPGRGLAGFPQEKLKWRIKTKKMRLLGRKGKLRVKRT